MLAVIAEQFKLCQSNIDEEAFEQAATNVEQLDRLIRQYFDAGLIPQDEGEAALFTDIQSFLDSQVDSLSTQNNQAKSKLSNLAKGKSMVKAYEANANFRK